MPEEIITEDILTKVGRASAEMPNPKLDSFNPHFKSNYASLSAVQEVVKPALQRYGLFDWVTFDPDSNCWVLNVTDGIDTATLSAMKSPGVSQIQAVGSEATYAGRYLRCNAYFLVGEKDDDGETAVEHVKKPEKVDYLTPIRQLMRPYASALNITVEEATAGLEGQFGVSVKDFTPEQVKQAVEDMQRVVGS